MGNAVAKSSRKKLGLKSKKALKQAIKKAPFKKLSPAETSSLITEHMDSAKRLAWSFLNRWRIRIEEDEVLSITGASLCEAANRFNKKLGVSFRTFFFYYLRGMLLKEIARRINDQRVSLSIDTSEATYRNENSNVSPWPYVFVEHETPEAIVEREEVSSICRRATSSLDTLEQDVIRRFFVDEQSVVDIARDLGYCRCHISRVKSRALATLASELEHLVDEDTSPVALSLMRKLRAKGYRGGRGRRKVSKDDFSQLDDAIAVGE